MRENWDQFETNMDEVFGLIPRKAFIFNYQRFEVWQGGTCILSDISNGQISASILNNDLHVAINDDRINAHINKQFSFGEISTIHDRVMWSKDMYNLKGQSEKNTPDLSSLFYQKGVLTKVTYTIHDPNTLIEFYFEEQSQKKEQQKIHDLDFTFKSSDHLRYENGLLVSGPHGGAERLIKVNFNINAGEGYIVTIENLTGTSMAPKQMKIIEQNDEQIVLRGYGYNNINGAAFDNWGLVINFENNLIKNCILHIYSMDTQIEYLP